ncbi:MAG: hypothetical protein R3D84_04895 [Paracoccaceae bacterium]
MRFYNQRGTAEQHQERQICLSLDGYHAGSSGTTVRLHCALAYNLATFLRCIDCPRPWRTGR